MIHSYQAKYFAHELSKKATSDSPERFGTTLMDAKVELNPHQIEAALFAFNSPYSKGAILADEVGLGKTIEAGILLSQKWAEGKRRILIICPSSLRKQWVNELSDKFYLKAEVLETKSFNDKQKQGIYNPFDTVDTIKVCSYQFARRKEEEIQLTTWDLIVIDEAHYLRNAYKPRNITAKSIQKSTRDYKKILLTATPLQNRLEELYGLVSFIDSNIFGDIKSFRKNFINTSGGQNIADLRTRLKPIIHRSLRKDVKEFINYRERIPLTQKFTPTKEEQELYENVLEYLRQEVTYAFPLAQKHLMQSVIFKLLGSSSFAISRTLETLIKRLKTMLLESKVVEEEFYNMLMEDYEQLESDFDEFDEEDEQNDGLNEITYDDKLAIEAEIKELESFLKLANNIEYNEKGEKLIIALDRGFEKLNELGANKKALIFTESTRTQQYLFERLSREKYAGRILLFNGSNNDDVSKTIYNKWINDSKNEDKLSGSRAVDIRQALVDAFKSEDYDIMIATEAAAEGINLQFCSMVVNYDLPWNPQRIEQRIGRCHRYGQKFDVVVVNFLNAGNAVENRVFELLDKKFKLFEGVFGASDEVLGTIENGIDFEKQILNAYRQCRTTEEIEAYFTKLQADFEDEIDEKVKNVQKKLFEHFEVSVIEKLKVTLSETKVFLEKYEKWLWELTRFYLHRRAQFIFDDYTFILDNGKTYTLNRKREDANRFLINGEVAQSIIKQGKKEKTPFAKLKIQFTATGLNNKEIEELKSHKGLIRISNLSVNSEIENHSVLMFAGVTDNGEIISEETCRFLMGLSSKVEPKKSQDLKKINEQHISIKQQRIQHLEKVDSALMQREFTKFHNWADDKIHTLENDIRDARKNVREIEREALKQGLSASEVLEWQEKLSKAKKKVSRLRSQLFEKEDEIEQERDDMIEDAKKQLNRTIEEEELYTIAFEIV